MHPSLSALSAYRQFVVYRIAPSVNRPGKTDKFPCDYRTGQVINAHDPQHWTDYATAKATAIAWGEGWGVGFVFTENDPFWFLDIDGCLIDGQWSPLAVSLCQMFSGAAIEVSGSRTGLHIFGTGKPPAHKSRNQAYGLEFYTSGRFVALTELNAVGDAGADMSAVLPMLVATYFQPDAATSTESEWNDGPCEEWNGPADDSELWRRAMQSRSTNAAFGNRASFADLWLANESVLAVAYPDPARGYDASAADAALAQHLSFWTGKDCARIRRLMEQSSLVRDKWEREDYLPRTILGAVSRQVEVLQDAKPATLPPVAADGTVMHVAAVREDKPYLSPQQQQQLFAGCIYVKSHHRALMPDGSMLKPDTFKVHFGGNIFMLDAGNEKTTRDPWEAWTQSQVLDCPKVHGTCFKPNLAPRAIVTINHLSFVNTFVPVEIRRIAGDAEPFLGHLRRVLPNERDRNILLSYMAAIVQYQGIKFQWSPLLQGVEGNGKTLFTRCVAYSVGERYTHWVKASKISANFNSWLVGKVFYAVEDIYVPDSKREILEDLKPMITGGAIEIEAKGVDQISTDICGNFMFNSNHKDAIRKTANDRRFCVLYSAQQQASDLRRDGMDGSYFPDLYKWLNADGFAIVAEFLHSYNIAAEFNPASDCQRAPVTSSTDEAIAASLGGLEQEILEHVAQGSQGFCGGFISTTYYDRLIRGLGLERIQRLKRAEILEQLGYVRHPALTDGRVNNTVLPDNNKPRLYVKRGSLVSQLTSGAEIAKRYEEANKNALQLPFAARA